MFSFISQNWRGQPLLTHATIVSLIAATRTNTGLKVCCVLDTNKYPKGITPTVEQMARINLKPDTFPSDWNYAILSDGKQSSLNYSLLERARLFLWEKTAKETPAVYQEICQ